MTKTNTQTPSSPKFLGFLPVWGLGIILTLLAVEVTLAVVLTRQNTPRSSMETAPSNMDFAEEEHSRNPVAPPAYDDRFIVERIQRLLRLLEIEHVVVWGHPLHSHTHSYVHEAFVRAAKHVNVDTHWVPQLCFDDQSFQEIKYEGPVERCLFLTEGQVMEGLPQSATSWYILHNASNRTPLNTISHERRLSLQFYNYNLPPTFPVWDHCHRTPQDEHTIYMPWATNLLPGEFQSLVNPTACPPEICVVGQNGPSYSIKIQEFAKGAYNLTLNHQVTGVSNESMIQAIRNARCAPALMNPWQKDYGYIPCRIMKNISYGHLGVTSSVEADYMLHHNTLCDVDEYSLGQKLLQEGLSLDAQKKQSVAYQLVQQRHTYLNRWEFILFSLKLQRDTLLGSGLRGPKQLKHQTQPFKVLHLTCHSGCSLHLSYVGQRLGWELTTLNLLQEQKSNTVYNMTQSRARKYWDLYKNQLQAVDLVISSDTAPLARIVLEHLDEFPGRLIVWICNRFDYHHEETGSSGERIEPRPDDPFPDPDWYQLLVKCSREHSDKVRVVSYTKLERIYAIDKGIFWDGPFADAVLKPVCNASQKPPEPSSIPEDVQARKSEYLFIPPYLNDEKLISFEMLDYNKVLYYRGRYNGPEDLVGFKAILHIPYAASNLALFENLQRGLVYYLPSESFQRELLKQHPWFSGGVERFQYSEWYDLKMRHLFVYFDSWPDLLQKLKLNAHAALVDTCKAWSQQESLASLCQWNVLAHQWW